MADEMDMIQDSLFALEDEPLVVTTTEAVTLAPEPLFVALLREAVAKLWPGDAVMDAFVNHVAGPLTDQLATAAAKGGDFAREMRTAGKDVARYSADQSMRAHLINGLFPVLNVARTLQTWNAPRLRYYDDATRRLFIAGYVLHDFLKLPGVEAQLTAAGFSHDKAVGAAQMPTLETIFRNWCMTLGLDQFLSASGGADAVLHDLIYVACNTQIRWGTLRNLSLLPRLSLASPQLELAEDLSHLADLLAYVVRTPQEIGSETGLKDLLSRLSNAQARFTYHHLADNRGLLSNFVHNAALKLMQHEARVPLLYAPSGVIYLERREGAPGLPAAAAVAEEAIQHIREVVSLDLRRTRSGMKRDGKGMKHADFYWLVFDLPSLILLGVQGTFDVIREGKAPSAGKRFAKMRDGGWLDAAVDLDLPDDLRVDQLAEWCYLAEKQVAFELPGFDVAGFLLQAMELEALREQFEAVPRDNRAGGVGYHWYFAAGHYLKQHQGLDPTAWRERVEDFARQLSRAVAATPQPKARNTRDDWDDLRDYIAQVLTLGSDTDHADRAVFAAEWQRYTNAKRKGHGTTQVCALCSSPYRVDKQREAAVLFAPQVYSNKQALHGTDALRSICSICGLEMMLRQLLMSRSAATGGDFEGRRVRYLFFYPTYFFTPETLHILRRVYSRLQRISFTELRRQLVNEGAVDLSPATLQRLEPLLLVADAALDPASDRYVRFHFSENEPTTFYFIGVPPAGRDAKDAEAWVHPAFLALLLPLCLDVKVVASEASLPLLLEAGEIDETVFLDAPHAAIRYLTGGELRVNIDHVLPTLQRLAVGYLVHLDANSGMGRGGYDYRWQNLPAVARDLDASPLYAFHYLKKWQRQQGLDTLPQSKVRQYLTYFSILSENRTQEDMGMSHARELTLLYRQFYRAKKYNSNSILRPISIAANAILAADARMFADVESLQEAVRGALHSFIDRAYRERLAFPPRGSTRESQETAIQMFATYFVERVFLEAFRGDRSALRGKQLNLLKNACEVIYLDEAARDRAERELVEESDSNDAA
ncbi:MAG TPA: type I-D CRISPR-associated protein Cas10d/Csc3 [Anaerolineae bacterium]|nr:type I-D CRISPR-associated protein Cas10d/Csc3 [Anaerolineae bacterium]HQI84568.1 type I-D CRISPR-associated protein Cas10d/Csc3 [Anaerolineae bacterium]